MLENAKWIWLKNGEGEDEYADFYKEFECDEGNALLRISVDGDYELRINGRFVASNQFGDFEHYKIYDEIDISAFTRVGRNTLQITVWHMGVQSQKYRPAPAGLIYEVESAGKAVAVSDRGTLSRKNPYYESGRCKRITSQLGLGFAYNANGNTDAPYEESAEVEKRCNLVKRIGEKLRFGKKIEPVSVKNEGNTHFLIDLGAEVVGVPHLHFFTDAGQKIIFAWGEHILDGGVRRVLGDRDFSIEYTAHSGENDFTSYMLRLGLRYVELFCEKPIRLEYAGVIPQYYPTERVKGEPEGELDRAIYNMCARTLELSMMEHYVDCPWREQCLYVMDSRNQMLCGYYAFEGGNTEYVRANLKLILADTRDDGLLSITYPSGGKYAIPSFSLHLYTSIREYYGKTGDKELLRDAYPKLSELLRVFLANLEGGLLKRFGKIWHWNFYDWSDNLAGTIGKSEDTSPDLVCNCLLIKALGNFAFICAEIGEDFGYAELLESLKIEVRKAFFNADDGLFTHLAGERIYTALGNALAIDAGLCGTEEAKAICRAIVDGRTSECSLSLKPFVYDALLMTDDAYKEHILAEIRKNYKYMLDNGATSAWETIKGASDFDNAGSLCHGWSAIPVYYYHKFGMVK